MKFYSNLILVSILFTGCVDTEKVNGDMKIETYPITEKIEVVDEYFDTKVNDPYQWLEDDTSSATKDWVKRQNEVTFAYLDGISSKAPFRARLEQLWNYTKQTAPFKVGEFYFFYRNDGLQNQAVIFKQKGLDGEPEVFIDPNAINTEGTTSINIVGSSRDGKYVTLDRSDAGSDWSQLSIMEVVTGKTLEERLDWVKFSGASWYEDGFFYSRYPEPIEGKEYSAVSKDHMVYYHKVGTPQSQDELVYRNESNPNLYHWVNVTEDENYLILYAASGTDGYECYFKDLANPSSDFSALFTGFENKSSIIDHVDGSFLVRTDIDAPNYRLISISPDATQPENWKTVIAEKEHLLEGATTGGGKLFLDYLEDASTRLYCAKLDGTIENQIDLPGSGSAGGLSGKKDEKTLFYTYTSFNHPTSVYRYDVETGLSSEYYRPETDFDPQAYVSEQVKYKSKDGTMVNMFIVHRKDLKKDGKNPLLLYGYGGFNVSITPSFSISNMVFLEQGGVYAVANLRGGGEYGEEWHRAGMLQNKQNVFDDFISAAEYLIAEGYTSAEKLAIQGGSNGGLLVGACMTQRPDLFAVAFPAVGVMDMLRYHKFTVGWGWIPEYGCSDSSKTDFDHLYSYSPYHNLEMGVDYPATMITTADHDDRVVPAHSFKFAARLQECHIGDVPVIIRIDVDAGHGAGKPTDMLLDEIADKLAFLFDNIGEDYK